MKQKGKLRPQAERKYWQAAVLVYRRCHVDVLRWWMMKRFFLVVFVLETVVAQTSVVCPVYSSRLLDGTKHTTVMRVRGRRQRGKQNKSYDSSS
jgi:hypothetical protein